MRRRPLLWLVVAVGVGVAYLVIGVVFGNLAGSAASTTGRTRWRLAAWIISGIAFVAQIAYERVRLRSSIRAASFHGAVAAAFGGFFLAVAATINKMTTGNVDARYFLALVFWPLLVAVPAFVAALVLSVMIRPRPAHGVARR